MDEMAYQAGMASLGLLEWQDRRESRDHLDLKVRKKSRSLFRSSHSQHLLYYQLLIAKNSRYISYGSIQNIEKCSHKYLLRNQNIDHGQLNNAKSIG